MVGLACSAILFSTRTNHSVGTAVAHPGQSFLFGPCSSLPTIYSAEFVSGHLRGVHATTNLLEQAINSNDGDAAAKLIQEALGIQRNDVVNYFFPKTWPSDREQRARIIGEWLQTEVRFLAS